MEKTQKKSTGFYPTPQKLVSKLLIDYIRSIKVMPSTILESSAGEGDFIMATWEVFIAQMKLSKREVEKMVAKTILMENDKQIAQKLRKNISNWCNSRALTSRPAIHFDNFLLNGKKYLENVGDNLLVVGNPPWDEFTTRKHDGALGVDGFRSERQLEKIKYQSTGFKNVYQCFLSEILSVPSKNLDVIFVLPRQLLGDLSAQSLRKQLIETGSLNLSVYCNKDEPDYYFEAVARTAEILCLEYKRGKKTGVKMRRGFNASSSSITPYGADYTLPCFFGTGMESVLSRILSTAPLSGWDFEMEVSVARGKVDYTCSDYKKATNGRTVSAYQFENAKSTDIILNKILPDSKRKLKAAILKTTNSISDSMLRVSCKDQSAHPYLMLLLNSRPVELALRSVISNINLNNFRLMSLPIPQPTERTLAKAKKLCQKCINGQMSWDNASDELAKDIYKLTNDDMVPLKLSFPDRNLDKAAA